MFVKLILIFLIRNNIICYLQAYKNFFLNLINFALLVIQNN